MSSAEGQGHGEEAESACQRHSTSMNESRASIHSKKNTHCSSPTKVIGVERQLDSEVWGHFKRRKFDGKWEAVCNYCDLIIRDTESGTEDLHSHFEECPQRVSIGTFPFTPDTIRRHLAEMIVGHGFPLSMVENRGFRKFSYSLNPLFKMVSQEEMEEDILGIYRDEKYKTIKLMESNKSRIAVTIGKWTSDHQKKGFIAIIAHYVDDSWVLQSQVLRFACVPCSATPEDLSKILVDCLMDWNIDRKLSTLTINDGFANDSVIDLVLEKLPADSFWLKGTLLPMQCFACILNSMAQDGLEVISDGVERVRDSVAFWMATSEREKKFKETAIQLKVQLTKRLILDCKSRWSSTYLMLHGALGYKDVFSCLKELEPLYDRVPLEEDWERVKQVCERLKLFYKITKLFSKKPMANHYFPMIYEIKIALREWIDCGCDVIQSMA